VKGSEKMAGTRIFEKGTSAALKMRKAVYEKKAREGARRCGKGILV